MGRKYTNDELNKMTLTDACTEISNAVYENTRLIELLEGVRKIRGNGHHVRQNIAKYAKNILIERWE